MTAQCTCHQCIKDHDLHVMAGDWKLPLSATQMILCPTCGNKRCPHASDHRLACTSSNESGQPGSVYGRPLLPSPYEGSRMTDNELEAKLEADEIDAERYRWLRDHVMLTYLHPNRGGDFDDCRMRYQIAPVLIGMTAIMSEIPFDDAVDYARAALTPKEAP